MRTVVSLCLSFLSVCTVFISAQAMAVDLSQGSVCRNNSCYEYKSTIDTQVFLATPKWNDQSVQPPLSIAHAVQAATRYAAKAYASLSVKPRIKRIDIRRHAFSPFGEHGPDFSDNWYYVISFGIPVQAKIDVPDEVVVLMDGTVVTPTVDKKK